MSNEMPALSYDAETALFEGMSFSDVLAFAAKSARHVVYVGDESVPASSATLPAPKGEVL